MAAGTLPLDGVRVLDLSRVLAGPVCTMVLADLGADVVKVERPGSGDDTRAWGPPFIEQPAQLAGMSAYFASVNRNKRSLTLDLVQPAGREVLIKLIESSDVVVENFLPSVAAKFNLTPEKLKVINPRLIVCSISGFGRTGPNAESPGYDFVIQTLAGLMSITGEPNGQPMKVGVALTDVLTGLYAAIAILAALRGQGTGGLASETPDCRDMDPSPQPAPHRGEGVNSQGDTRKPSELGRHASDREDTFRHLDLSLFDCTLASLVNVAEAYLVTGNRPTRYGNAHPQIVPYECFASADGYVVLAVGNDNQWRKFCAAAQREDLGTDQRFATNPLRVQNRESLAAAVRSLMALRSTGEWTRLLTAAEVPHAPVLSLDEAFQFPQVAARRMIQKTSDGLKLVASPIASHGLKVRAPLSPPRLGQHTDELLSAIGYTAESIARMRGDGVI